MAKKKFIDRLFPVKYNFYEMLSNQAKMNLSGVETLCNWLTVDSETNVEALLQDVKSADAIRMDLEKKLTNAFSTPFDRGDIYTISIGMDKVIEYAKSTLLSMKAYNLQTNNIILQMVENLKTGTEAFAEAVAFLQNEPLKAQANIPKIRETHNAVEQLYRDGMADIFQENDPMDAFRKREVYHHIKDASANLEDAVDILHRIVVRLT